MPLPKPLSSILASRKQQPQRNQVQAAIKRLIISSAPVHASGSKYCSGSLADEARLLSNMAKGLASMVLSDPEAPKEVL